MFCTFITFTNFDLLIKLTVPFNCYVATIIFNLH